MFDFDWHLPDFLEQKTGQAQHKRAHRPMKDRDSIHSIHHWSKLVFPTDLGKRQYWCVCGFVGRSMRPMAIIDHLGKLLFDFQFPSPWMAKAIRNLLPQEESHQEEVCLGALSGLW